jgi:hypothetical protein
MDEMVMVCGGNGEEKKSLVFYLNNLHSEIVHKMYSYVFKRVIISLFCYYND